MGADGDGDGRNPLDGLFKNQREPVQDMAGGLPVYQDRTVKRKHPKRPSESRRKARMLTVTFSDPEIVARLRKMAADRGVGVSSVVEGMIVKGWGEG